MRSMVFRSSFAGPVALTLVRTRMAVSRVILIHGDALRGRPPHQSTRRHRLPPRLETGEGLRPRLAGGGLLYGVLEGADTDALVFLEVSPPDSLGVPPHEKIDRTRV